MTNPKTRKTGNAQTKLLHENVAASRLQLETASGDVTTWMQYGITENEDEEVVSETPSELSICDDDDQEREEEDEDDANSCSSFSLQECINEFRARRIRRISTQSREQPAETETHADATKSACGGVDPSEMDLINQNRSNKEQERKCKPCKDGFCYCFTSDSGEGGGGVNCMAAARVAHVRQSRRNKKLESTELQEHIMKPPEARHHSAPDTNIKKVQHEKLKGKNVRVLSQEPLTAISRLQTASPEAPLVHIIQELHNNCVISEVRVNKYKIKANQQSRSLNTASKKHTPSLQFEADMPRTQKLYSPSKTQAYCREFEQHVPTAPTLDKISEYNTQSEEGMLGFTSLDSSIKSNDTIRRKHKSAGRLLQKRLSTSSHIQFKPRNLNQPPPKPPRNSFNYEEKSSVSSLPSTSPSVREAEHILDEFLKKKGYELQPSKTVRNTQNRVSIDKSTQCKTFAQKETIRREARKSYPMSREQGKNNIVKVLPSCPSLSDIESVVASKKNQNKFEKNIRKSPEKSLKEIKFGWQESKISDMLNYDTNGIRKEFKSQAAQAEPQFLGWHIPPKIDIDTVDGNLASNIETKETPVKTRIFSAQKAKVNTRFEDTTQKFIWSQQLRNLSPWTRHKHRNSNSSCKNIKSNLKTSSSTFFNNSKKKILRLVSPKKENKETRRFVVRKTPLRSIGIQTSREDLRAYEIGSISTPQSPPGSYHSAVQISQQSSATRTCSQNTAKDTETQFDFARTVQSPPKKTPRSSQRKLNFPLNCSAAANCIESINRGADIVDSAGANGMSKTYRSFHSDLDQDVTLSKMGYILSNIRAKLEASDEHAERTFQAIERRGFQSLGRDCTDSKYMCEETRADIHHNIRRRGLEVEYSDPIYSEIEEERFHISGSPQYDNNVGIQHFAAERQPEILYAKVNKQSKIPKSTGAPLALGKFLHDSIKNRNAKANSPLPPLPMEAASCEVSYSTPTTNEDRPTTSSCNSKIIYCQSLNNVRVMEQHSPPKKNRNLSKSDLSLHRSDIFLENLCCSEIITEGGTVNAITENLEKVENQTHPIYKDTDIVFQNQSFSTITDSISYDLPHADENDDNDDDATDACDNIGSQLDLNIIAHSHKQSTPKRQHTLESYTTKVEFFVDSY